MITLAFITLLLSLLQQPTEATFSIAATDSSTDQVGAAGASCVGGSVYDILYHGVPGYGVLITQATPPPPGSSVYTTGTALLERFTDPTVILETITFPEIDQDDISVPILLEDGNVAQLGFPGPTLRQYGVVNLMNRADAYTGELIDFQYINVFKFTEDVYGKHTQEHRTGTLSFPDREAKFTFSAQQNIVTPTTLPTLVGSFVNATCDDLVGRLFAALQSIFEAEEFHGDVRCRSKNISASGAFLHVDNPNGTELFHADFSEAELGEGVSPFVPLKEAYEAWRVENPCIFAGPTEETPQTATEGAAQDTTLTSGNAPVADSSSSTGQTETETFSGPNTLQETDSSAPVGLRASHLWMVIAAAALALIT